MVSQYLEHVSIPSSWLDFFKGIIRVLRVVLAKRKKYLKERDSRKKKKEGSNINYIVLQVHLQVPSFPPDSHNIIYL